MAFAIKAEVREPRAATLVFAAQKTMYGGKRIAEGDTVFVFASENDGGHGLVARGIVTSARAVARKPGIARQTPRVSITVRRTGLARRPLGRNDLKPFVDWGDGQPETELNFKFYRQATNKIVGISPVTAVFLDAFFPAPPPPLRRRGPDVKGRGTRRGLVALGLALGGGAAGCAPPALQAIVRQWIAGL